MTVIPFPRARVRVDTMPAPPAPWSEFAEFIALAVLALMLLASTTRALKHEIAHHCRPDGGEGFARKMEGV